MFPTIAKVMEQIRCVHICVYMYVYKIGLCLCTTEFGSKKKYKKKELFEKKVDVLNAENVENVENVEKVENVQKNIILSIKKACKGYRLVRQGENP